jgi:L-ribulose-5-phosphate 4-epimerase
MLRAEHLDQNSAVQREEGLGSAVKAFRWAARRAFQLGLQAGAGGNISLRLGPDLFLTKPTGFGLTECGRSNLVLVNREGRPLEGKTKPTKEVMTHLVIYEVRREVGGIVHYHPPYATSYAVRNLPLPLPTLHARRILKQVPLLPEYPEGSTELAQAVREAARNPEVSGLLLAGHGLLALGPTIRQAQYTAELMEESARIAWLARFL